MVSKGKHEGVVARLANTQAELQASEATIISLTDALAKAEGTIEQLKHDTKQLHRARSEDSITMSNIDRLSANFTTIQQPLLALIQPAISSAAIATAGASFTSHQPPTSTPTPPPPPEVSFTFEQMEKMKSIFK